MVQCEDCGETPQGKEWQYIPLTPSTPSVRHPCRNHPLHFKTPISSPHEQNQLPSTDAEENGGKIHPSGDTLQNLCSNMTKIN